MRNYHHQHKGAFLKAWTSLIACPHMILQQHLYTPTITLRTQFYEENSVRQFLKVDNLWRQSFKYLVIHWVSATSCCRETLISNIIWTSIKYLHNTCFIQYNFRNTSSTKIIINFYQIQGFSVILKTKAGYNCFCSTRKYPSHGYYLENAKVIWKI